MKKLFAALCGLLSVTAAQACNWNAENCTFEMLNNIQRQIGNLKQNPKFMQEKFAELQAKAQYIDRKTASCSNWIPLAVRQAACLSWRSAFARQVRSIPFGPTRTMPRIPQPTPLPQLLTV